MTTLRMEKEKFVADAATLIRTSSQKMENAVKEAKRQHVPTDPILACLPRHGASFPTRYRIGEDGKTAEQRRTGKRWFKPALEFAERCHLRAALAREPRSGTSASNERGALCGTSLQDRKRPCDDERRHGERTRIQPNVAGRTLGHS